MSIIASNGRQTTSPGSSRASSPVPHLARRTAEDASWKSDKITRRYASSIARALSTWEASPEEWADYIAFLGRLLKAVQSLDKDATVLPHVDVVALRLAQCLSPALPSGVHQKALEIYAYIFETFGTPHVAKHLSDYLPGLSTVLSFASLSVRPALYGLLEKYIVVLSQDVKRPAMKSLILSMLPALEEENSEDFERAFDIMQTLELGPANHSPTSSATSEDTGFFWQCMFLAILTGVSRRHGALNYLVRRLPSFSGLPTASPGSDAMSAEAECAIAPEPGLLVRGFATGLSDSQPLVQRGFLDLLVSHLPLSSPILQARVASSEIDRLIMAATGIALRRDMSLNRRLWIWLLGSDSKADGSASPTLVRRESAGFQASKKQDYFDRNGLPALRRCILSAFSSDATDAVNLTRPFRVCHALMDKWEIGDTLIPEVFLRAMRRAYDISKDQSAANGTEVMKSARTFFDGVESRVIWGQLFRLLEDTQKSIVAVCEDLQLFCWILQSFHVAEEEMIAVHVPVTAVFLLAEMHMNSALQEQRGLYAEAILLLLRLLPADAFGGEDDDRRDTPKPTPGQDVRTVIRAYYKNDHTTPLDEHPPINRACITAELLHNVFAVFDHGHASWEAFSEASDMLIALHNVFPAWSADSLNTIVETCHARAVGDSSFEVTNSIVDLLVQLSSSQHCKEELGSFGTDKLIYRIVANLWDQLSPMNAKHQVEAVQLLWRVDGLDPTANTVKAALSSVMGGSDVSRIHGAGHLELCTAENLVRFAVLWKFSAPTASAAVSQEGRSLQRRGSVKNIPIDGMAWIRRRDVMGGPLFLTIDAIRGSSRTCQTAAMRIFGTVASSEVVLQLLLGRLAKSLPGQNDTGQVRKSQQVREVEQRTRGMAVVLQQIDSILRHANNPIWQSLMSLPDFAEPDTPDQSMVAWLVMECVSLIEKPLVLGSAKETAISILDATFHGPEFIKTQIQTLNLADVILQCVLETLSNDEDETHSRLLDLGLSAMGLRQSDLSSKHDDEPLRRSFVATRRQSSLISRDPPQKHVRTLGAAVPSKLLATLKAGFAAESARRHMDVWLDFLTSSLPYFGDGLITVLIPLVDMFCAQLTAACIHLKTFYLNNTENTPELPPDVVILWLLDGLDVVLAEAHDFNIGSVDQLATRSLSEAAQGVPSFASSKGPGSGTGINTANSRLTLVLALKDAVAIAMEVWLWSAQAIDVYANMHSSSTASNTAVRLRSRSRSMLEQIYTVQTLETLEVMIHKWCHATEPHHSASVLSLLQAMTPARPRSVLPATLDAMCSRCNASPASSMRQSSLTTELTAAEILSFLAAYLGTVDADATDEIWPDCTAFMRDVLSNPMPYRQVLPGLLWIASILAEHLANTNFGDQRKMRRELGDLFQRLLAACFATSPPVTHAVTSTVPQDETDSVLGQRSMDITVILTQIMPHIENLLDASDRVANAVNTIMSGIISHELRAKSFPANVQPDTLVLLATLTAKAPAAKPWRKEVSEAFMRPRFLDTSADFMQRYWMPVLYQWSGTGKEQMNDLLSRLIAPSSAGIMFGVGAAAARIKADIETQMTLRRLCVLFLASPTDTHLKSLQAVMVKLTELFEASALSSPSAAVKQEIFMVCRVLVLSVSPARLTPMWPLVNSWLKAALVGGLTWSSENADNITNLALLQACKLLEILLALSPNEFQLHEWLWVTDTTDAIHHSDMWRSAALSDQLAEELSTNVSDGTQPMIATIDVSSSLESDSKHQHMVGSDPSMDTEDVKAMSRGQFAMSIIRPYFSQLSINTYEAVYQMKPGSVSVHRDALLKDLLDVTTMIRHD